MQTVGKKTQPDDKHSSLTQRVLACFESKRTTTWSKRPRRYKLFLTKLLLLSSDQDYQNSVSEFRLQFKIPSSGFTEMDDALKIAIEVERKKEKEYEQSLEGFFNKFDIFSRWHNIIEYFLWCNDFDAFDLFPKPIEVEQFVHPEKNEPALFIRIYPETAKQDIVEYWSLINALKATFEYVSEYPKEKWRESMRKIMRQKSRGSDQKKILSQKEMDEMRKQGKTYIEIHRSIRNLKYTQSRGNVGVELTRFTKRKARNVLH